MEALFGACPHCHARLDARSRATYCRMCGLALQPSATTFRGQTELLPAPLLARLLARLLDYTILAILACVLDYYTQGAFWDGLEWMSQGVTDLPQAELAGILLMVLIFGYPAIFQHWTGQTPGKWLCRLKIVQGQEQSLNVWAGLARECLLWLTLSTGGWLLLITLLSPSRRALHDWLTGAQVCQIPFNE